MRPGSCIGDLKPADIVTGATLTGDTRNADLTVTVGPETEDGTIVGNISYTLPEHTKKPAKPAGAKSRA
jgi:hypothetical protein